MFPETGDHGRIDFQEFISKFYFFVVVELYCIFVLYFICRKFSRSIRVIPYFRKKPDLFTYNEPIHSQFCKQV